MTTAENQKQTEKELMKLAKVAKISELMIEAAEECGCTIEVIADFAKAYAERSTR